MIDWIAEQNKSSNDRRVNFTLSLSLSRAHTHTHTHFSEMLSTRCACVMVSMVFGSIEKNTRPSEAPLHKILPKSSQWPRKHFLHASVIYFSTNFSWAQVNINGVRGLEVLWTAEFNNKEDTFEEWYQQKTVGVTSQAAFDRILPQKPPEKRKEIYSKQFSLFPPKNFLPTFLWNFWNFRTKRIELRWNDFRGRSIPNISNFLTLDGEFRICILISVSLTNQLTFFSLFRIRKIEVNKKKSFIPLEGRNENSLQK
jgi:hypothetical protein